MDSRIRSLTGAGLAGCLVACLLAVAGVVPARSARPLEQESLWRSRNDSEAVGRVSSEELALNGRNDTNTSEDASDESDEDEMQRLHLDHASLAVTFEAYDSDLDGKITYKETVQAMTQGLNMFWLPKQCIKSLFKYYADESRTYLTLEDFQDMVKAMPTPRRLNKMKQEFIKTDINGDGTLTKAECSAALRGDPLLHWVKTYAWDDIFNVVFKQCDTNHNDRLSLDEYEVLMLMLKAIMTQPETKTATRVISEWLERSCSIYSDEAQKYAQLLIIKGFSTLESLCGLTQARMPFVLERYPIQVRKIVKEAEREFGRCAANSSTTASTDDTTTTTGVPALPVKDLSTTEEEAPEHLGAVEASTTTEEAVAEPPAVVKDVKDPKPSMVITPLGAQNSPQATVVTIKVAVASDSAGAAVPQKASAAPVSQHAAA